MRSARGIVSIRALIAMLIALSLLPIAFSVVSYSLKLDFSYTEISNELALIQLRRILLIAYDQVVNNDSIEFKYHGEDYTLRVIDDRLVLSPGYQMFLDKSNDISFYEDDSAVYLCYKIKDREYETPIMSNKRLYIDEFLDTDDDIDESDTYDE